MRPGGDRQGGQEHANVPLDRARAAQISHGHRGVVERRFFNQLFTDTATNREPIILALVQITHLASKLFIFRDEAHRLDARSTALLHLIAHSMGKFDSGRGDAFAFFYGAALNAMRDHLHGQKTAERFAVPLNDAMSAVSYTRAQR
jgi:hypothetical protein